MTSRERIRAILYNEPTDRVGFWLGNPADDTKTLYYKHFGIQEPSTTSTLSNLSPKDHHAQTLTTKTGHPDLELALALHSDLMWISPELDASAWKHLENKPMWDVLGGKPRTSLSQPGVFAECENVKEVEAFDWPNPDYLDFSASLANIEEARNAGLAVFGGMWCPFFHIACDLFGMEQYFIKMHTHPAVVAAVTEHIVAFYLQANQRCLDLMASKLDAAFFGNDFGSQRDLLISPRLFQKFVLPYFKQLIEQMKSYGLKVVLHSCGSIVKVIPLLLEAGMDALHPLQAKAAGMDAENLARQFRGDLVFIGGVDTQDLLPFQPPAAVRQEVRRLKQAFGERFIVSPSHEALLPNVSIENTLAMSAEATR